MCVCVNPYVLIHAKSYFLTINLQNLITLKIKPVGFCQMKNQTDRPAFPQLGFKAAFWELWMQERESEFRPWEHTKEAV